MNNELLGYIARMKRRGSAEPNGDDEPYEC